MTETAQQVEERPRDWYGATTDRVVDAITRMSTGERAALRRTAAGVPPPAFWRIAFDVLEPMRALPEQADRARDWQERQWASIVALIERVAEQHAPFASAGSALGARLSEARFEKLLRADGDALVDELRAALQRLRTDGARFDARFVAAIVLSAGRSDEETVRRAIARDYYRARAQPDSK